MARMGATHFLRRLHGLSLMEFHVLPCNLTRVMKIMGIQRSWLDERRRRHALVCQ
jgi:hypothetical protein